MNTDTRARETGGSRFEDRLLAAVLADFDQLTGAPGPDPAAARHRSVSVRDIPRRPVTARRAAWALTATAAAAAVAVVVASGVVGGSGARGGGPAGGQSASGRQAGHLPAGTQAQPHFQTAAYVMRHVRSALAGHRYLLITLDHAPDSQTGRLTYDKIWTSSTSRTDRIVDLTPDGQPVTGYLVTTRPHTTVSIVIDYRHHTWTRTVYPFGSATDSSGPAPRHETLSQQSARLRAEVASGKMTLVGRARIDGQAALYLRQGSRRTGLLEMWVDPQTYLPIRTIGTSPGESPDSPRAIRDDYQWLRATAANERQLTAAGAIPAGFTQVKPGPSAGN
jgi:hypothetical protein